MVSDSSDNTRLGNILLGFGPTCSSVAGHTQAEVLKIATGHFALL